MGLGKGMTTLPTLLYEASQFSEQLPCRQRIEDVRTTMTADHEHLAGLRLAIILLSLFLGTFLVAIDTTIVSVAIPKMPSQFHALNDIGWYVSAHFITITTFQPARGKIFKIFSRKVVYLSVIVDFESALVASFNEIYTKLLVAG